MNEILVYIGSGVIIIWGIAHLIPTRAIVNGFGTISEDNRKILAMASIAEGFTLIFLGALALLVTFAGGYDDTVSRAVLWAIAAMLLVILLVLQQQQLAVLLCWELQMQLYCHLLLFEAGWVWTLHQAA